MWYEVKFAQRNAPTHHNYDENIGFQIKKLPKRHFFSAVVPYSLFVFVNQRGENEMIENIKYNTCTQKG